MTQKKIQPWKKSGEPVVLANKYGRKLISQQFLNPTTGREEEFSLFAGKDWSIVLPITKDGGVIAVRQYKQGCDQIVLELPAGAVDANDKNPTETIERELLEETGYKAEKVITLDPPLFMATRSSPVRFHAFFAINCEKIQEAKIDASEEIETEIFPLGDWIKMCLSEIVEPSSIVATFRSLPYLKQTFGSDFNVLF
ncbi:MAG: NUDIX hydrolase [Patescibacteria group bacterium]